LESKIVTFALLAAAVFLLSAMTTCSSGFAWMATKCAMLTFLEASPDPPALDDESSSSPPQAARTSAAAASRQIARATALFMVSLLSSGAEWPASVTAKVSATGVAVLDARRTAR
jgi:hypothetical protein